MGVKLACSSSSDEDNASRERNLRLLSLGLFFRSSNGTAVGVWVSPLHPTRKQAKPAPNFIHHSVSGYYTAVLTAFFALTNPFSKNLTMVKFLFCLKMPTLRTVELCFSGGFTASQNLTTVKFWDLV